MNVGSIYLQLDDYTTLIYQAKRRCKMSDKGSFQSQELRSRLLNADDAELDRVLFELLSGLSDKQLELAREVMIDFLANQSTSQETLS